MEVIRQAAPHVARLATPVVVLVLASTLAGLINSDPRLAALDTVQLYAFDKAAVDTGAALANNTPAMGDWAWLWDRSDAAQCLDMTGLNFPSVRFIPGSDPTGPSCQIAFRSTVTSNGASQLTITPVYTPGGTVGCVPGVYALELGSGKDEPVAATTLAIQAVPSAFGNTTLITISPGGAASLSTFAASNQAQWALCNGRRQILANQYLNGTSCQTEASQMCSCVRAFAGRVANPNTPLHAVLPNGTQLGDALNTAVGDCVRLRRSHDVRSAWATYRRSQALLVVGLAVVLNALYGVVLAQRNWMVELTWLCLLVLCAAVPSIPGAPGSSAALQAAVYGPAALAGAYELYLNWRAPPAWRPYLHPTVFALVLCSLTLFTLAERGVAQAEYLFVEAFKCHAVAGFYAAGVWYRRYLLERTSAESAFSAATVDQAHQALVIAGLAAAADSLLVPYPAKGGFELHWLLPLAFAYLGLSCARWTKAPPPPDGPRLTCLSALGTHAIALLLCGYFLNEILLTGDRRYADFLDPASGGLPLLARAA